MEEVLNEDNRKFGNDLKVIIVGNISTGKTSILNRYINNEFQKYCKTTIAPQFSYKVIKSQGIIFRIQFWDLPGQERNPIVTSLFCKDSNAVIFCCEVNNNQSKEDINKWITSLQNNIDLNEIPKIIIENKCDLLGNEDKYEEDIQFLKNFSDEHNFNGYFRTSALNGYNIEKAMQFLIDEVIKTIDEEDIKSYRENSSMISLSKSVQTNKNENCSC